VANEEPFKKKGNSEKRQNYYKAKEREIETKITSHKTTVTQVSDTTGKESFDDFIQQIQHEIKQANGDPNLEFKALDGKIISLAKKKVGSRFLQDQLKRSK
jgi:lipoate-protein ligase A